MAATERAMEKPKLKDVFEELVSVSPKWKLIAIQLEVDDKKIQGENYDERLLEVLREFLKGPQPSWEGIVRALNTRSVGENKLAGEVERKYCSSKETTSESDVKVKPLEMGMSSLTIAEEKASKPKPEAEPRQSKEGNEAARPLSHVDAATEPMKPKNPRLVPIRMPSTSSGSDPFTSPDFASVESQCSLPYLKTPDLSDEARKNFIGRLLHKTQNMEILFSELMFKTRKSLESSKVPLEDLLDVLLPIESATVQKKKTLCESWKKELTKAKRIFEVFRVLQSFTSFFNHEIIEQIIKCFGNEDDRQRLAAYKLAFTEFCKLSVCECPNDVYGKKTERDAVITVKIKDDFDKYTVNAINNFRYKLCKILGVSEYNLRLINVTDGCTQIQFAVSMDLLPRMFPLSEEKVIKLKEERVTLLKWKTDTQKHHNIEITSESPNVSERAQASTQESTSFSQREEDFQNMVSTISCTLKQMGGFQTKFLADTVKDLVTLEPPAKSVDDFFDAMKLHASSPMDFEIVALIIKILGKKGDRAMLAEYTKQYNIRLASAASSKQEPPTVTELPLTLKDEFSTPTTPHLQPSQEPSAIKSRNDSKAHAKLEEFFGIIGYPHEVSKIAYKTEAATLEGGEYEWFCSTVDVPGIGEVSGCLQCSESEAENSAAEKAFSKLVQQSKYYTDIGVLECPMCQYSRLGSRREQLLTERCPRCDKLIVRPLHHKPLPLSTQLMAYIRQHGSVQPATQHTRAMKSTRMLGKDTPQKLKRRVDRDNMFIEALQHKSRSIREHVDLMMSVYDYLHSRAVRYNTIQYKTTQLPGKSRFESTVLSPSHLTGIGSGVCLTEAEAEDNAALKVYMKLLSDERYGLHLHVHYHPTTNEPSKTYMKEKLKEYFSTSQENLPYHTTRTPHYRTKISPHTMYHGFQSTVDVPGIGTIQSEPCGTRIVAEESAACAAYLALTQRHRRKLLATIISKTI